jgi:hypothetical protein
MAKDRAATEPITVATHPCEVNAVWIEGKEVAFRDLGNGSIELIVSASCDRGDHAVCDAMAEDDVGERKTCPCICHARVM